jgi:hypothetical protein
MGVLKAAWLMMVLVISACQAGGDAGNPAPAKKSTDQDKLNPDSGGTINTTPSTSTTGGVGTLTGDAKCWKKMLETPEYLACKAAGKVFNRVKKVCVELGMTLTNDCSGISAAAIQDAHNQILKPENLPKAYLTTDQCGSYTLNGKKFAFAYVMGQQFFDDSTAENKAASYKIHVRKICYHPNTNNPAVDQATCVHESVNVSNAAPVMADSLGSCE